MKALVYHGGPALSSPLLFYGSNLYQTSLAFSFTKDTSRSVVTLPFAVYQQIIMARLENLKLELPAIAEELRHETSMAVRMYKWDERMAQAVFRRSVSSSVTPT